MKRVAAGLAACVFLLASGARAGEVGFPEDFALAKDRSVPLKQLIPGTEDYYHYQCIHAQNTGKLADVDAMLPLWIKRHGRTDRVTQIENRQALLKYEKEAAASLSRTATSVGSFCSWSAPLSASASIRRSSTRRDSTRVSSRTGAR